MTEISLLLLLKISWGWITSLRTARLCKVSCGTKEWRSEVWWVRRQDSPLVPQAEAPRCTGYECLKNIFSNCFNLCYFVIWFKSVLVYRLCPLSNLESSCKEASDGSTCGSNRLDAESLFFFCLMSFDASLSLLNCDVLQLFCPQC